ncbi:hypothetical protein ABPG72_002547 [Tetrahymena utriculariae]
MKNINSESKFGRMYIIYPIVVKIAIAIIQYPKFIPNQSSKREKVLILKQYGINVKNNLKKSQIFMVKSLTAFQLQYELRQSFSLPFSCIKVKINKINSTKNKIKLIKDAIQTFSQLLLQIKSLRQNKKQIPSQFKEQFQKTTQFSKNRLYHIFKYHLQRKEKQILFGIFLIAQILSLKGSKYASQQIKSIVYQFHKEKRMQQNRLYQHLHLISNGSLQL